MNSDEHYMGLAIEEAGVSLSLGALPVGVVIVLNDTIVGKAHREKWNTTRFDHAEMIALRGVFEHYPHDLCPKMTLYSTLEPCMMCFGAILGCKIGNLVYALEDPHSGATHCINKDQLPFRHQGTYPLIVAGVLREPVRMLFRDFFEITDRLSWKNPEHLLRRLCLET